MTIQLEGFQSFDSVQEMDLHVKQHVTAHYYRMNDTEREILRLIARFACKYPGAAHLKVQTICNAIGKSDATVRRTLRKLQALHIIRKEATIRRVKKGFGANILVINPYDDHSALTGRDESRKPVAVSAEEPFANKETITLQSNSKELLHNTYSTEIVSRNSSVDHLIVKEKPTLYKMFKSVIFGMLGSTQQSLVSRLYGVFRAISYRGYKSFPQFQEHYETIGYQALLVTLQATKRKNIRNIAGYYVGTLEKMNDDAFFQQLQDWDC